MDQSFRDESQAVEDVTEIVEEVLERAGPKKPAAKVSPALAMAREAAARAAAKAEEEAAPKSRAWGRDLMMLTRRSHLYAGLLLYPWVLLYGVTAFLFNHPTAFSDQTFLQFGKDAMKGTALEGVPTAPDIAAKVVAALNARSEGGAKYTLIKPDAARFERGGVSANVKAGDGKTYSVSLQPDGGLVRALTPAQLQNAEGGPGVQAGGRGGPGGRGEGGEGQGGPRGRGTGRGEGGEGPRGEGMGRGRGEGRGEGDPGAEGGMRRGRGEGGPGRGEGGPGGGEGMGGGMRRGPGGGESPTAPFATMGLTVEGLALGPIREALPGVLAKIGLASPEVSEVRLAPEKFQMEAEGKPWLVTYNALNGSVSGREVGDAASQAELTTRRFLLRLHLIHGYPSEFGQRWIWAFIVDCMAFLMVFWGISGIIMWWQIKRTRRIGAAALALSTAAAVWIGVGMHNHFVSGGR